MAKTYRVIQITLNHFKKMSVSDLPTKRIKALSQRQTYMRVLPTRWRQKSTGTDMEQNYVTVTLCIEKRRMIFSLHLVE